MNVQPRLIPKSKDFYLSYHIAMLLLDGSTRPLSSFYQYLARNIDPRIAVREYIRSRGRNRRGTVLAMPIDRQIKVGQFRVVRNILRAMRVQGRVEYSGDLQMQSVLKLTDDGLRYYRGKGNSKMFKELFSLVTEGKLAMTIYLLGTDWEVREDEGN